MGEQRSKATFGLREKLGIEAMCMLLGVWVGGACMALDWGSPWLVGMHVPLYIHLFLASSHHTLASDEGRIRRFPCQHTDLCTLSLLRNSPLVRSNGRSRWSTALGLDI